MADAGPLKRTPVLPRYALRSAARPVSESTPVPEPATVIPATVAAGASHGLTPDGPPATDSTRVRVSAVGVAPNTFVIRISPPLASAVRLAGTAREGAVDGVAAPAEAVGPS